MAGLNAANRARTAHFIALDFQASLASRAGLLKTTNGNPLSEPCFFQQDGDYVAHF
jgi:hypothetical protein